MDNKELARIMDRRKIVNHFLHAGMPDKSKYIYRRQTKKIRLSDLWLFGRL
jgi:hypothetical protein